MSIRSIHGWVALGLLVTLVIPGPAVAEATRSPAEIIGEYGKKTVATLNDTNLTPDRNYDPLRQQLFDQLNPIIDFKLMTRSALGPEARSISQQQLEELTKVFRPLVVRLYVDQLLEYLAMKQPPWVLDAIEVNGQEIKGNGSFALVRTTAKVHRGTENRDLSMNFKLYKQKGKWLVYDLQFEGLSLVENYRSQFTSILANNDVNHLIDQLNKKLETVRSQSLEERVKDDGSDTSTASGN